MPIGDAMATDSRQVITRYVGNAWAQGSREAVPGCNASPIPGRPHGCVVHSARSSNPGTRDASCRSGARRTRSPAGIAPASSTPCGPSPSPRRQRRRHRCCRGRESAIVINDVDQHTAGGPPPDERQPFPHTPGCHRQSASLQPRPSQNSGPISGRTDYLRTTGCGHHGPMRIQPCHVPLGVQFLGRTRNDHAVIAATNLFHTHSDWHTNPPIV
jgi:hypothetical protein